MDDIKLKTIDVGFDIIDRLHKENVFNTRTYTLLSIARDHGGYIAGGFGTMVAKELFVNGKGLDHSAISRLRTYLGRPEALIKSSINDNLGKKYVNPWCGDIDVWFPSKESWLGFFNDGERRNFISYIDAVGNTVSGCATEYVIKDDARIQVITKWFQPIESQVVGFDIYNAMVALDKNKVVLPEHWEELERARTLHVVNWGSRFSLNRVLKWFSRKDYRFLTAETASKVFDTLIDVCENIDKYFDENKKLSEKGNEIVKANKLAALIIIRNMRQLRLMLKPFVKSLTGEQLLKLSVLLNDDFDYDIMLQELQNRSPREKSQITL